jgi:hypothetical protein
MSKIAENCVKDGISGYFELPKNWKSLVIQNHILKDDDWIKIIKAIVKCLKNKCPIIVEGDIIDLRENGKTFQDVIDIIDNICANLINQ